LWLAQKQREHIDLTAQLDEEEEALSKRRLQLEDNIVAYEEELRGLEEKRKKLKEDQNSLTEEEKWISTKQEEHVKRAQELDDEKKWLDSKQKELDALTGVFEEGQEEASPESNAAWESAKQCIQNNSINKFIKIINDHPEIIDFIEAEGQNTLLHWAVCYKRKLMAEQLLTRNATFFSNENGCTPYDIAAMAVNEGHDYSFLELKDLLAKYNV